MNMNLGFEWWLSTWAEILDSWSRLYDMMGWGCSLPSRIFIKLPTFLTCCQWVWCSKFPNWAADPNRQSLLKCRFLGHGADLLSLGNPQGMCRFRVASVSDNQLGESAPLWCTHAWLWSRNIMLITVLIPLFSETKPFLLLWIMAKCL